MVYDRNKNIHSDVLPSGLVVVDSKDSKIYSLNKDKIEFQSLGTKIRISQDNGDVLGISIRPEFDDLDSDDIHVSTVSNVDAFDVAEMFGTLETESTPIAPVDNDD